ncbi:MAG: hypothetical protein F4Z36_09650 [Acidimicrobiia bacterium]|nr:hypothetical protein [Acidimicrobiia bacterium]
MSVEMAIWRMAEGGPQQLESSQMGSEQRLEEMLEKDPAMSGKDLLIIGRQVYTDFGGYVDLLALDGEGCVHVLELKRDLTPRDVVAQTLDYGFWAKDLGLEDLENIYLKYQSPGHDDEEKSLEDAFADHFGFTLPDVINEEQQFTVVASELDHTSDRIIQGLAEYKVPINAAFFRHFKDGDRNYLARTWLIDPQQAENFRARSSHRKHRPWNGRDFYVVLGRSIEDCRWEIACKYGFLNAGHGSQYWKRLGQLKPGSRVFAYVPKQGYVGIGEVTGPMIPGREAKVKNGKSQLLMDQPGLSQDWKQGAISDDPEVIEMVVPVRWLKTKERGYRAKGLFSNPNVVCKLRDTRTIEAVLSAFDLSDN